MHEKLIEQAAALEKQIRAIADQAKPRSVFLDAAANSCHGIIDHLQGDERRVKAEEAAKAEPPKGGTTSGK